MMLIQDQIFCGKKPSELLLVSRCLSLGSSVERVFCRGSSGKVLDLDLNAKAVYFLC